MFRRIIIAAAASLALVVATGGAALACVVEEPPGDPELCGVVTHEEYQFQRVTTTDWLLTPTKDGWVKVDERTVTDADTTEVVTEAQHYSLKGSSGIGKDDTPLPPSQADYWQANTHQEPHGSDNITWLGSVGSGLHYASNGSSGNRDWFFFAPEVTEVVHHSHQEYKFSLTETTGWVLTPTIEGWTLIGQQTITDDAGHPCDNEEPGVASASWVVTNPSCDDRDGSAVFTYENATLVSATVDGEDYPNLGDFPQGTHPNPAPSGSHWVLTFEADPGFEFEGSSTLEFDVPDYYTDEDCAETFPVGVQFDVPTTPPTCEQGAEFDAVFPIIREGYTLTADPYTGPGEYTITATAAPGFTFEGEGDPFVRTTTVDLAGPDVTLCPLDLTPVTLDQPTVTDACGTANDQAFLPADKPGVDYSWESDSSDDFTIVAEIADGYVVNEVAEGWQDSVDEAFFFYAWTPEFTDVACPTTTPPPVTPVTPVVHPVTPAVVYHSTPSNLASTGSDGAAMLAGLATGLLVLGAGAAALATRRKRV